VNEALQKLLPKASAPDQLVDPVVSALKKATDLNKHEKRLLPCIVDVHKLASTDFSRVHLPNATIDAIRTMVSLPLLFPDAFRTGILGEHSAGGALLFGPPGTGKTLLARAVASESGARMLAIQVRDTSNAKLI
jgi:ATP-dependent 26S proteasome regulatory subunit